MKTQRETLLISLKHDSVYNRLMLDTSKGWHGGAYVCNENKHYNIMGHSIYQENPAGSRVSKNRERNKSVKTGRLEKVDLC